MDGDHRGIHLWRHGEDAFDLAEFDAEAAHLHLEVAASHVCQGRPGVTGDSGPAREVAGAVHPAARRAERVRDEPLGREVTALVVAPRQLRTGEVQLTGHPVGYRMQPVVEHEDLAVPFRPTDRYRRAQFGRHLLVGDADRGLGGPVQVVDLHARRRLCGQVPESRDDVRGQCLADAQDVPQSRELICPRLLQEDVQQRRYEGHRGDRGSPDQFGQVRRVAMSLRRGDHQTGARGHSPPELPHREVERGLRAQEHGVIGVQSILRGDPVELVDDRGVRHRNAFGPARGPGRVDDVRRVVRPQRSQTVALLHRRRGDSRQIEATDIERLGRLRQSRRSLACHQGEHGPGVVDYVGDAVQRMVRVDGQVGAAGNGDRVHRDHQVDRPRHRKSDSGFRADPTVDQDPGQRVHPDSQVAVRQRGAVIGLERDIFCVVAHRLRQSGRERARRQHHSGVVATTDQFTLLSTGEHRQVTDGNERLVDDLVDQRDEAVGDRAHRLRVEQVVGVGEHRVESGRLPIAVVVVRQDQMQVELCDALGHLDGFDAQAGQVEAGALDVLERQADLEDRMVGGRTHRIEYLDEAFERHIGVGERFGVTIADGVQERTETTAEIDLGPHGEGVDEHADDTFDLALDPSAHRRTDGDVGVAAQAREQ